MSRCQEVRAEIIAFDRGELDPLRAQRVEAHLARCARCRRAAADLRRALEAGREPIEVGALETEQLVVRLGPWLERRSPSPLPWVAAAATVCAAALAGFMMLSGSPTPAPVERIAAQEGLRVLGRGLHAGRAGWEVESGFAIVEASAEAAVRTPEVVLRARSGRTRFWVERQGETSWFEVLSGTLVVEHRGLPETIAPGQRWAATATRLSPTDTVEPEALAFLADPFMAPAAPSPDRKSTSDVVSDGRRPEGAPAREERRRRAPRRVKARPEGPVPASRAMTLPVRIEEDGTKLEPDDEADPEPEAKREPRQEEDSKAEPDTSSEDPFASLEWRRAEQLGRAGRWEEALVAFETIEGEGPPLARRLARLERARILGLRLKRPADAWPILDGLGAGSDEVARQSRFTRCEVLRGTNPCRARSCLQSLASSPEHRDEAETALVRWRELEIDCAEVKKGSGRN